MCVTMKYFVTDNMTSFLSDIFLQRWLSLLSIFQL